MLAGLRISIGCIKILILHSIAQRDELGRMVDEQVQEVGESSRSRSAEVDDTVETHQEKGKHREESMQTIIDNLREENETTTLLLFGLAKQFQRQNKLLETFATAPVQSSSTASEPYAADFSTQTAK